MKKVLFIITLFLLILPATVYGAPTSSGTILLGRLNPTMNGVQQSTTVDYKNVSKITITGSWSSYVEGCDPSYNLQFYSGASVINNSSGYLFDFLNR